MAKTYRYLNVIGLLLVLIVNGLAEWLPLGGKTTGQISAMFPVGITPAPYAFGIWGLIYLMLALFVGLQFLPSVANSPEMKGVGPWFFISCLFNAAWIIIWHQEKITASVYAMLGLFLTLIAIYILVRPKGRAASLRVRYGVQLPFSLYLGWISVATLVNITVALYAAKYKDFDWAGTLWTVALILLAGVLGVVVGLLFRDPAYTATIVWALAAVGVANRSKDLLAASVAWAVCALLVGLITYILLKKRVRPSNSPPNEEQH